MRNKTKIFTLFAAIILIISSLSGCKKSPSPYVTQTPSKEPSQDSKMPMTESENEEMISLEGAIVATDKFIVDMTKSGNEGYHKKYAVTGNIVTSARGEAEKIFTDYYLFDDGNLSLIYKETEKGFVTIAKNCSHFSENDLLDFHSLSPVKENASSFLPDHLPKNERDGEFVYSGTPSLLREICLNILCEKEKDMDFTSLKVTVISGKIAEIKIKGEKSGEENIYTLTITASDALGCILPDDVTALDDTNYYDFFTRERPGNSNVGIPSVGKTEAIVIPVQFKGYEFKPTELYDIELAFSGSESKTGWESLRTYYEKSSYGKLELSFTFADVYDTGMTPDEFAELVGSTPTNLVPIENIIDETLEKYSIDPSFKKKYDTNSDGFADAVYLIYSAPIRKDDGILFWAWTHHSRSERSFGGGDDSIFAGLYVWTSKDFFYEKFNGSFPNRVKVNATTVIHETGHMLGLDDYYDGELDKGPAGGLGGGDMMDCNVGDHSSVSKILLSWANPSVVTDDAVISLNPLCVSGDCIVIPKEPEKGIFSEFILIDFFSPSSLNSRSRGVLGLPYGNAVRIYHVDATPKNQSKTDLSQIRFLFNNSTTEHKFISVIECDGDSSIESTIKSAAGELADASDYYKSGDSLPQGLTWYDGTPLGFTLFVTSLNSSEAVVSIDFHS